MKSYAENLLHSFEKKQALTSLCFLKTAHPRQKDAISYSNDSGKDNDTFFICLVAFLENQLVKNFFSPSQKKWPHYCSCAGLDCLGLHFPLVIAWPIPQHQPVSEIPSKNPQLPSWGSISFFLPWVSLPRNWTTTGTSKLKGVG